jgi:23S rRNA pseudouridine2605 synthase
VRINQFVARATGLSRRDADTAITAGRVSIGNRTAVLGETVEAGAAVALDNQPLSPPGTLHYVLMNKPIGYICSRAKQGKEPTIYDLLPASLQKLRIAGRLDADSSGLLVLSDDGDFIQRYSHPSAGKTKVYELELSRRFIAHDGERMAAGIPLRDGVSFVKVEAASGSRVTVSMEEGRKRQLRRTFGALGYSVRRLHRIKVGEFQIGALPSGQWEEVQVPHQ